MKLNDEEKKMIKVIIGGIVLYGLVNREHVPPKEMVVKLAVDTADEFIKQVDG